MQIFDAHPSVIGWASEAIKIPYFNPFSRKGTRFGDYTVYIPDFFVVYIDKNNKQHKELIEVKPQQEMPGYAGRVSKLVEARQALNMLKWKAAMAFCQSRNWTFRVATEADLFSFKRQAGK